MKKQLLLIILLLMLTSCKEKTYTVTFIDDNNKLSSVEVEKGDNIKNIDNPTKDGYLFLNWLKDGVDYDIDSPIYEDITLEASWIVIPNVTKSYTISFDFGHEIRTMSVKEGDKVTKPTVNFVEDKYKFIGWYLDDELFDFDTVITSDLTLKAKFEKIYITIKYDLDGGSGTIQSEIKKETIPAKPKNPKKFGYTFSYWTINDKEYNFDTPLYEDVTIKANYVANIYVSVMFDSNGGNNIPSRIVLSGETIDSLPVPIKDGYTFLYWSLDNNIFDLKTKIDTDITLIAVYKKK